MKSSLRMWIDMNEAVKENIFTVVINDTDYIIDRRGHLLQKRDGDKKPKDFNMSKEKYRKAIEQALNSNMVLTKSFSLIWTSSNGKTNILSLVMKPDNKTFSVFGAIMNSSNQEDALYKSATQRLKINL